MAHDDADQPRLHRLLVAQAIREGLSLLTADRTLLGYGEAVRWAG